MPQANRLARNQGRIELLAVRAKVQELFNAGYDRRKIHTRLREEGVITMSYATFCFQLGKLSSAEAAAARPAPAAGPRIARAEKSEPFSIIRNPDIRDLA
jgi:hypothetical protein